MRELKNESGASSVEYGLIVFAIAGLIVVLLFAFGGVTQSMFSTTCDNISSSAKTTKTC